MRLVAALTAVVALAAGAVAPAAIASATVRPQAPAGSVGIRLVDVPSNRRDDPRALSYIIDHVQPGASIERRVEVVNGTQGRVPVKLYAGSAAIARGEFVAHDDERSGEIPRWASVEPSSVELDPGEARRVLVRIRVPQDARHGEHYGAVWAELPAGEATPGVNVVNRVGVRIYLSVGSGREPSSDFEVSTLTARRDPERRPVVEATVRNTGERALDMRGSLVLEDGPAGLRAGPFPAELGTTLGVGQSSAVRVALDEELPNGPWKATITLQSGELERQATAVITFPSQAGEAAAPVKAREVTGTTRGRVALGLAIALLLLVLLLAYVLVRRLRARNRTALGGADREPEG
jgi:hypothetical protein